MLASFACTLCHRPTRNGFLRRASIIFVSSLVLTCHAAANSEHKIVTQRIADDLYMLEGAGGNMAVLLNKQQSLLVDAQYDYMTPAIKASLQQLQADASIATLVNTHFHRDHTYGNSAIAAGKTIIAHQNAKIRLEADAKFDQKGLPTETITDVKTLDIGRQQVVLQPMPASHTDGDVVVWFKQQNVVHLGDLFFADRFPFIDLNSGGSVDGYINNIKQLLAQVDDHTKIIPGHGALMDKAGLQRFYDMMLATRAEVQAMRQQGLTADQAVAKGLSVQWQSWHWNFITEEKWIRTLYQG